MWGPLKCGGPCSAEHVRTLVNPALVEMLGTGLTATWTKFVTKARSFVSQHGTNEVEIVERCRAKRLLAGEVTHLLDLE